MIKDIIIYRKPAARRSELSFCKLFGVEFCTLSGVICGMTTTPGAPLTRAALTELPEQQRQRAFDRYQTLRPHLEQDVPLARVAAEAPLPLKSSTALEGGLVALGDRGERRSSALILEHIGR
jgi:hypothetical protein